MKTIKDYDLAGKRVLIRADFNVPLDKEGRITNDNRILASLPTIRYALEKGAKVILMSHLGRPKGKPDPSMSLQPVARRLSELLKQEVLQCSETVGEKAKQELSKLQGACNVALLENLRFTSKEEGNDADFAKGLAENADLYINDAFGSSHRAHASIEAITKHLPSAPGFLLEKEIRYLGGAVEKPKKPFAVILGGSKVSDKIGIVENLISKVDRILIGGAMAYTFLKVKNVPIGASRCESDKLDLAKSILEKAASHGVEILLPEDHVTVEKLEEGAAPKVEGPGISEGRLGVDIGPKAREAYSRALETAKTVIWNGPMGVFEMKAFAEGSLAVAKTLAGLKKATTIIGGGDTASCVIGFGLDKEMSHISTGGGASLEYLEGKPLPGVVALEGR